MDAINNRYFQHLDGWRIGLFEITNGVVWCVCASFSLQELSSKPSFTLLPHSSTSTRLKASPGVRTVSSPPSLESFLLRLFFPLVGAFDDAFYTDEEIQQRVIKHPS